MAVRCTSSWWREATVAETWRQELRRMKAVRNHFAKMSPAGRDYFRSWLNDPNVERQLQEASDTGASERGDGDG